MNKTVAYQIIVCGGTFDHFHTGHKDFLRFVLSKGQKVIIGITSDKYIRNSKFKMQNAKLIESFKTRKEAVISFLQQQGLANRAEIMEIDDLFGPTLQKNLAIDALVVTEDSIKGAHTINQKRKTEGLSELFVHNFSLTRGEDNHSISSSRIRSGEINRDGRPFIHPTWLTHTLVLTPALRETLQKPFGELMDGNFLGDVIDGLQTITVGDVVTKVFNANKINQAISVVDFLVEREKKYTKLSQLGFTGEENVLRVINPASHITPSLWKAVTEIFNTKNQQKRIVLEVEGEEDLVVLPLVLLAPLDTTIFYGQPGEGIVRVLVTEPMKEKAYNYVNSFEILP